MTTDADAITSSGSSCCFAAAEAMAVLSSEITATADAAKASGSSCCSFAAAVTATAMDAATAASKKIRQEILPDA